MMDGIKEEKMQQEKRAKLDKRKMVQGERRDRRELRVRFQAFVNFKSKPEIREYGFPG